MLSMATGKFHTMLTPFLCLLTVEACTFKPGGKCNKWRKEVKTEEIINAFSLSVAYLYCM